MIAYTRKVGTRHNAYDATTHEPISGGQGWKAATNLWRWLQDQGYNVLARAPKAR